MPKGILCLCVTCTQALSAPGKSSPLPAGCPQPARALLALVAHAHDIGGPAHPAIPSARTAAASIWAFELQFLWGWRKEEVRMSLNFGQIWVSPLLQEAGGRGRCWAESSTWFPAGSGSEAALPSGSTAGCHPGSVLLSAPHMAALVLGSGGWAPGAGPLTH